MRIIVKNIFVKLHHSIRLIERFYDLLHQIYNTITIKFLRIKPKLILQIFFKVLNDLVKPNKLVLILLVFNAYPYIMNIDIYLSTIINYNIAMQKTMNDVKRFYVFQIINNTLNNQNSLSINLNYGLPFNLPVLIFW